MPHRQMTGIETPMERAAEAASPRKECPMYSTPGGGVMSRMTRSSSSHAPTDDGTGGAASPWQLPERDWRHRACRSPRVFADAEEALQQLVGALAVE